MRLKIVSFGREHDEGVALFLKKLLLDFRTIWDFPKGQAMRLCLDKRQAMRPCRDFEIFLKRQAMHRCLEFSLLQIGRQDVVSLEDFLDPGAACEALSLPKQTRGAAGDTC
jgi:hypothetical protein